MDRLFASQANSAYDLGHDQRREDSLANARPALLRIESEAALEKEKNLAASDALRAIERRFVQLSAAAQSFAVQLDFQKLLAEIAAHAYGILPAAQVVVYSNLDGKLLAEASFPKSASIREPYSEQVRMCARRLKPVVSNEPDPNLADLRNSISAPFVASQNQVLGVVEFRNKRTGGWFTQQDARVAQCFALVATSAVDRARLFFRIEEWNRSLETLLAFNATVNQHLEPAEMVRELVVNVTGFLNAQGGAAGIAIGDESGLELECDGFYFGRKWRNFSRKWRLGEGIPGTVLETQFPYLSREYHRDALRDPELADGYDLGSCICVPIKNSREEVLGFFQLHRRAGEPEFTWQDAAFLESLGNTAAVAIENARLVKSLKVKTDQVKRLSQRHVRRLEEERSHIARELHDETGQVLIGLKLRLQILAGLMTDEQSGAKQQLGELRAQLNQATVQLKDMAKKLRPPTLDELGFEASIRELVSEFRRHAAFAIHLNIQSQPALSSDALTALYRIVQECLTNVAKHAKAANVEIDFLRQGDRQILRVIDDGVGFRPGDHHQGLGFVGIKERVAMLGGQIEIRSQLGRGAAVEVIL